jgi:hypothetical protein
MPTKYAKDIETLQEEMRKARVRAGMNPDEVCPYDFPRGS